jgi:hypothetical protein
MEALQNLARILRRVEPTTAVRNLRDDVGNALAIGYATDAEILEMMQRAVSLKILRAREAGLD